MNTYNTCYTYVYFFPLVFVFISHEWLYRRPSLPSRTSDPSPTCGTFFSASGSWSFFYIPLFVPRIFREVGCSRIASFSWDQGTVVDPTQPTTLTLTLTLTPTRTKTGQKRSRNAARRLSHRTRKFADNSEPGPRFRSTDHAHPTIKTKPARKILANMIVIFTRFLIAVLTISHFAVQQY